MGADWKRLERAAWVSLGVHLVAGVAMLLVLRQGLATEPDLGRRMIFVAVNAAWWRAAWGTWNLAALSILWFFYSFGKVRPARGALLVGSVAVALDLAAEALMMWRLPSLALAGDVLGFLHTDRRAVLLTGFAANGLYTLASLLLVKSSRGTFPRWTEAAGWGVGAAGAWLSWAAWAGSTAGMLWSNAALVPCLVVWQLGVALEARRRSS